jgi:hypothetical protein
MVLLAPAMTSNARMDHGAPACKTLLAQITSLSPGQRSFARTVTLLAPAQRVRVAGT